MILYSVIYNTGGDSPTVVYVNSFFVLCLQKSYKSARLELVKWSFNYFNYF